MYYNGKDISSIPLNHTRFDHHFSSFISIGYISGYIKDIHNRGIAEKDNLIKTLKINLILLTNYIMKH